jgi:hypothetical protein
MQPIFAAGQPVVNSLPTVFQWAGTLGEQNDQRSCDDGGCADVSVVGLSRESIEPRVVVSEPLISLPGVWREVPPSTALIVGDTLQERPFQPRQPA